MQITDVILKKGSHGAYALNPPIISSTEFPVISNLHRAKQFTSARDLSILLHDLSQKVLEHLHWKWDVLGLDQDHLDGNDRTKG
jgi:hypothetical protein